VTVASTISAQEATIRRLFSAQREGRIDDAVELLHPDVLWQPWFRPARSVYSGASGFRTMLVDAEAAKGPFWFELTAVEAGSSPDQIQVRCRAELVDQSVAVVWVVQFRDGLICDVSASLDGATAH
jgi:hypothetical protein